MAHLEAEVALPALFRAYPELTLAVPTDQIRYKPAPIVRSPAEVPVRLRG